METSIVTETNIAAGITGLRSIVSFKKFVGFLRKRAEGEKGTRQEIYKLFLDKFEAHGCLDKVIDLKDADEYGELFEIVLSVVLPFNQHEDKALVALSSPLSRNIFFTTRAFSRFFSSFNADMRASLSASVEAQHRLMEFQYVFIVNRLYGLSIPIEKEWVHTLIDPNTGLYRYFRLNIDSAFVDVAPVDELPPLDLTAAAANMRCDAGIEQFDHYLPLSAFKATGFNIITLTEVTQQYAVEQIGKVLLSHTEDKAAQSFAELQMLIQTILGSKEYRFGLMPFFTVNGRAALLYENFPYSILVGACWQGGVSRDELAAFVNAFSFDPKTIDYAGGNENADLPESIATAFNKAGIGTYMLAPVYYSNRLIGICEVSANKGAVLPTHFPFANLQPALPYISQVLRMQIDKFNLKLEEIIKDKFTNIQPSVQWKFNEVAWHYFRSNDIEQKNVSIEKVTFENVYPLYGAVDLRNSTTERNKALRRDLQTQLDMLHQIISQLPGEYQQKTKDLLHFCETYSYSLTHDITVDELTLEGVLHNDVHPFLRSLTNVPRSLHQMLDQYWQSLDENTGLVCHKRFELEESMQMINRKLNRYFADFKDDLGSFYPCYFETFRTDGVEYDLYIGQAIAPKISFTPQHLQHLRLWQVRSMAEIAVATHSLLPKMPVPLQTTQLLFVNGHAIDITFRNDERRFDVEGSYNIRYQVIKKRIDKVHLRNNGERLTQPGKIAIVYFSDQHADEYVGYIRQLQAQHLLLDDLEYLELEELQGVAGLRALRVGVNLEP